jgi:hypothetical protein
MKTSAVISLVIEAIGRCSFSFFANRSFPSAESSTTAEEARMRGVGCPALDRPAASAGDAKSAATHSTLDATTAAARPRARGERILPDGRKSDGVVSRILIAVVVIILIIP